jgi:hypothetical protein
MIGRLRWLLRSMDLAACGWLGRQSVAFAVGSDLTDPRIASLRYGANLVWKPVTSVRIGAEVSRQRIRLNVAPSADTDEAGHGFRFDVGHPFALKVVV